MAKISKSMLFHKGDIESDFATMKEDWSTGMYYVAGEAMADLVTVAIGPVKDDHVDLGLDIMAIPDFAAGFLYGMVGDNHLSEFETCFQSSGQLMPYINAFISDLENFKIIAAFENFEKFLFHF